MFSCWQLILATINFQLPTGSLHGPNFPQHRWLRSSAVEGDAEDQQLLPALTCWPRLLLLQRKWLWRFSEWTAPSLLTGSCLWVLCLIPAFALSDSGRYSRLPQSQLWQRPHRYCQPPQVMSPLLCQPDPILYSYISQTASGKRGPPLQRLFNRIS